jgi:hypothetical protein
MGGLEMVRKNPRFAGPLVAGECGPVQGWQGGARPPRQRPDGLTWWMAVRRLLIPRLRWPIRANPLVKKGASAVCR